MIPSSYVVFYRGSGRFALPLEHVCQIARPKEICPIPQPKAGVLGILESQGKIFTILQTKLPHLSREESTRILLLSGTGDFGIFVDGVEGVRLDQPTQQKALDKQLPAMRHLDETPPEGCWDLLEGSLTLGGSRAWLINMRALQFGERAP